MWKKGSFTEGPACIEVKFLGNLMYSQGQRGKGWILREEKDKVQNTTFYFEYSVIWDSQRLTVLL